MSTENSELMTRSEVASLFRVTQVAIINWEKTGVIPAPLRIGASVRYRRSEIETVLSQAVAKAEAESARAAEA